MVHVVFQEEGVAEHPAKERLVVGEADDMLGEHIVGWLKRLVHIVPAVVARAVEGIAQVNH